MSFPDYLDERWPSISDLIVEHAEVVLIAVAIATATGILLGIAVEGHARASRIALGLAGTMLTIPSFALYGLLIPLLGLGYPPTITALVLYNPALTVRDSVLKKNPDIAKVINPIAHELTNDVLQGLNAAVDIDGHEPDQVAQDWLQSKGFTGK